MRWSLLVLAGLVTASDRLSKLEKLSKASGLVKLDSRLYEEFTQGSRDYSLTVLLTALSPQFKCTPCQQFQPEHRAVAQQWQRKARQPLHKHFFAVLDFPDGQDTFRKLALNTAPVVQFFAANADQPTSAKNAGDTYDFRMGPGAAEFSRWVVQHLQGTQFSYSKPVNWSAVFTSIGMILTIGVSGYMHWNKLAPFLMGRYLWAAVSLAVILLMISGRMWCQIRNAPFAAQGGFIAAGYSNQYGVEVYIVAGMYAVLAFAAYTLAVLLPRNKSPSIQRIGIYVWCGVLISVHSILVSIFKTKNPGYPFTFLWGR